MVQLTVIYPESDGKSKVVFDILSPCNTFKEMTKKLNFYDCYGVEEYYLYDPDKNDLSGWLRSEHGLEIIEEMHDWVSPRLGIRFVLTDAPLEIFRPEGEKFLSPVELSQRAQRLEQRSERLEQRAAQAELERELEHQRALRAEQAAQRMRAQLLALGLDPDA